MSAYGSRLSAPWGTHLCDQLRCSRFCRPSPSIGHVLLADAGDLRERLVELSRFLRSFVKCSSCRLRCRVAERAMPREVREVL
jgi:hypothetical protein